MKYFALLVFVLTCCIGVSQTTFEQLTFNAVKQKAASENKLIFVDLYFTGCAPCKQMDENVFPSKEVSEILTNEFISFKSDILKEDIGKQLSLKYGVGGFPTFLFLTAEGTVIDISGGFHDTNEFVELLSSIIIKNENKAYKKYSPNLNGDYPSFYEDAYLKGKRKSSFEVIDAYLKTQKDLSAEIPFVVITGLRVGGRYQDFILKNAKQLAKSYSRMQVRNALLTIIGRKAKAFGE